jgi:uncharacterized protein (TIGR03435 family)
LWAYDIRSERLLGKPKGLDAVRYDIVAVAPQETPVLGRLNRMMRSLLAERFKLVVHNETRELLYYAMIVDKNGPEVHTEDLTGPLDARKGRVEVVVIDRVENRPSEN